MSYTGSVRDPSRQDDVPFDWDNLTDLLVPFSEGAAPAAEPDIEVAVVVTVALATEGGWQAVKVERRVRCPACNTGGAYREAQRACSTCDGTGRLQSAHGQVHLTSICPECGGKLPAPRGCRQCAGGFVTREEHLRIRVPTGVKPGQVLRLAGMGHERGSEDPGDLHVDVLVEGASSGVGPLRVPLARAGELPARCFVCAGRHEVTRVPVAVRHSRETQTVELPLCPRDHARVDRRASSTARLRWAAIVAAVGAALPVFFALQTRGMLTALAAGATVSLVALAGVRLAFARADARSPLHVWLDEDRRELVFPPLSAARAEE